MVPPWWLLVAFVFGGVSAALTSSRVVRTKYGDVSGVIVTPDNRRLDAVEVFRGVPYASPPVGSLRFMPPVTGSLWSGVKVADRFGPVCPQRLPNVSDETAALKTMARGRMQYLRRLLPYLQNQSEDCLYLNIYAPAQVFKDSDSANEGATANKIYTEVLNALAKESIPFENVIGFASDGCNAMMGRWNSVSSRFKEDFPGIIIQKCICHSLALCASEACKALPRRCEDLSRDIYNFFKSSCKRVMQFEQFQVFCNVEPHRILRPSQTRWLSLEMVVRRINEQWEPLTKFFQEHGNEERLACTVTILDRLTDPVIKLFYEFLEWVLPKFTHLNKLFQSEKGVILTLHSKMAVTYTVNFGSADKISPKPVLVFIHGESYEWNSGNPYDGTVLASYGGLVVVTINYRLGILGFLNLNSNQHLKSPSNYGLMDQIAALHWIQENIAVFGGDPSNVTLMGHGTGAACVGFLMASSAVPDVLFHRAILLSGSPLSPLSLVRDPVYYGHQVAKLVNCSPDLQHLHLLNCLRDTPLDQLLNAQLRVPEFTTAFGPSVDGVIIDVGTAAESSRLGAQSNGQDIGPGRPVEDPKELVLANGFGPAILANPSARQRLLSRLSRFDLMLGVVRAESFFAFTGDDVQYGIEADRRTKILKTYVKNTYKYHLTEILATIVNEYTDWDRPVQHPVNIRDETLEALSDAQVVAPVINTADLHSANRRNSYLFVFDYQTKYGDYQQRQGCIHGEELPYIFGAPLVGGLMHFPRNYTKSEVLLSEAAVIYWSNFARTGNPNEPQDQDMLHKQEHGRFKNIEWTAYETVHKKYLSLDTKPKLKSHYRAHRLSFWLNLVPELHKPGDDVPYYHHMFQSDLRGMTFKPGSERTTSRPAPDVYYRGQPPATMQQPATGNKTTSGTSDGGTPNGTNVLQPPPVVVASSSSSDRGDGDNDDGGGGSGGRQLKNGPNGDKDDGEGGGRSSSGSDGQDDLGGGGVGGGAAYQTFPLALAVAIGIGCSLLFLNIMIFAVIYCNKSAGWGGRRGSSNSSRRTSGAGGDAEDLQQQQDDRIRKIKKRPENGGPMTNLCSTGGATELLQMMETRPVSQHLQHQHQQQHQQPHSILKKPPVPVTTVVAPNGPQSPTEQGAGVCGPVAAAGMSRGAAQPPPAEFADVAAQCYHPSGSIVGIGAASTLPRPPPPPKCPRPDHHHHHHGGGHHHQQHLHGTIRRHAAASSTLPACTCSGPVAAGAGPAQPPPQHQHPPHASSSSLAVDAATEPCTKAVAVEELHV